MKLTQFLTVTYYALFFTLSKIGTSVAYEPRTGSFTILSQCLTYQPSSKSWHKIRLLKNRVFKGKNFIYFIHKHFSFTDILAGQKISG